MIFQETGMQQEKPAKDQMPKQSLRWLGAGIEFCGVMGIFCYMGNKLDKYFYTSPFLLITGFFIGFIGILYIFYKESK